MAVLKVFLPLLLALGTWMAQASDLTGAELAQLKPFANSVEQAKDVRLYYLWASWCPDCRQKLRGEIPSLEKEFPQATVQTINMDKRETKATGFIADEKLKMAVLRDENKVFTKKFKLFSVPAWVVMKKDGENWKVFGKSMGSDMKEIRKALAMASVETK